MIMTATATMFVNMLELECQYAASAEKRQQALQEQAKRYASELDAAYGQRQFTREHDRKQWLEIILPSIQKQAMLAKLA